MVLHPLFQVFLDILVLTKRFWSGYGFAPFVSGVSEDFYDDSGILGWTWFCTLGYKCFWRFQGLIARLMVTIYTSLGFVAFVSNVSEYFQVDQGNGD